MSVRGNILLFLVFTCLVAGCGLFNRKKKINQEVNRFPFNQFQSHDIPVFFSRHEGPVISLALLFRGGKLNYSKQIEGIEYLALRMAIEGGTLLYSPTERRNAAELLGAKIALKSGNDYSAIILTCPAIHFTQAWDFFVQALLNPTFDETIFNKVRDAHYRNLNKLPPAPETLIQNVETDSLFQETVYGKENLGSATALLHYGLPEIREYFKGLCTKKHIALAIYGKTDTSIIRERITSALADLPEGFLADFTPFELPPNKCIEYFFETRSQIARCIFSASKCGSVDAAKQEMGLAIVAKRMNATGAMKFSYGLSCSRVPFGWIQIEAEKIAPALREFSFQMRSILEEGFFNEEIEARKELWISGKYFVFQDPAKLVETVGKWVSSGDQELLLVPETSIRNTDKAEADRIFRKSFVNLSWIFVGDTSQFEAPNIPTFVK